MPLTPIQSNEPRVPGTTISSVPSKSEGGAGAEGAPEDMGVWQGESFGFGDILDAINPLQHIPVINTLYRAITGDEIGAAPKAIGGSLFGGVIGLVASIADTVIEEISGKDINDHVAGLFKESGQFDDEGTESEGTDIAEITGQGRDVVIAQAAPVPNIITKSKQNLAPASNTRFGGRAINAALATPAEAPVMPSPKALAADPRLVQSIRAGKNPFLGPKGNTNNNTWLKMMNAAHSQSRTGAGARFASGPVTGSAGLAAQTIARANAAYGANQSGPITPYAHLIRR